MIENKKTSLAKSVSYLPFSFSPTPLVVHPRRRAPLILAMPSWSSLAIPSSLFGLHFVVSPSSSSVATIVHPASSSAQQWGGVLGLGRCHAPPTNVSLAHSHWTMYHHSWTTHTESLEGCQSQPSDTLSPTMKKDKHWIKISLSSAPSSPSSSPSSSNCASYNAVRCFSIGITRSITVFARSSVSLNKGANWGGRGVSTKAEERADDGTNSTIGLLGR